MPGRLFRLCVVVTLLASFLSASALGGPRATVEAAPPGVTQATVAAPNGQKS